MIRPKRQIRTELYIAGDQAKAFFHLDTAPEEGEDVMQDDEGFDLPDPDAEEAA